MNSNRNKLIAIELEALEKCISNAISFLYQNQLHHGEFRTYISSERAMVTNCTLYPDRSPYITTFILYSINFVSEAKVREMTYKALSFFLEQMKNPGLWKFFSSQKRAIYFEGLVGDVIGIVPDLDDTACVSYALKRNNIKFDSNMKYFINNKNKEGIFYTWLLNKNNWQDENDTTTYIVPRQNDICCGVNANILLYLGETNETKAVCVYLNDIIRNHEEERCKVYFPDKLNFYYLLSRAYFNGVNSLKKSKKIVIDKILSAQKDDGGFGNPLATALAVCTLLNFAYFDSNIFNAIKYLLNTQTKNGFWSKEAFFLDYSMYYGSEELTSAICIEAIARCRVFLT